MEEESNNRRLVLAAGLCLIVLMAWQTFFPRAKVAVSPDAHAAVASSSAGATLSAATSTRAVEAPATERQPAQVFSFNGSVLVDGKEEAYEVTLSNQGGGIERFVLPGYHERDKDNRATSDPIGLANPTAQQSDERAAFGQMAGVRFLEGTSFKVPSRISFEVVEAKDDRVRYRYRTPEGIEIERDYQFNKSSFEIELAVTVRNASGKPQAHRLEVGAALEATDAMVRGGGFLSGFVPPPDHLQGLCDTDGSVKREAYEGLKKETKRHNQTVRWVAADRQYFLAAIVSREGSQTDSECRLEARDEGRVLRAGLVTPLVELKPGEERRHRYTAYLGVKKQSLLTLVNSGLEGAVDYTILGMNLAPLCAALLWILAHIHTATGSWGIAILGLTLMVKVMLFPVNQRAGKASRALLLLKPEMEQIRVKYPDDRLRQNEETMRLYKEHGVSPTGGCLPMALQMPIWFALYRSLWVSVDLYQQGFLWIADLTTRDPFWILPVALVVVMFIQQKLTPTVMDPAQAKVMLYTMPLMFGAMMTALPAGLAFYILVNTLLTIAQQHFINRSIGPPKGPPAVQGAKT